ncbi:MAG: putative beta-lysine N-acetyltransferase [Deltaproteobacteria bacterium]|nr:putative beta-lysine N-acetyltransferase [Deltaproteobacteria bacterium]
MMKLAERDAPSILPSLEQLARDKGYEKIFVKTPARHKYVFARAGYEQEARIPHYFKDREDAVFMAKYFSASRSRVKNRQHIIEVLALAHGFDPGQSSRRPDHFFRVEKCQPEDALEMSRVFKNVFETYPFPIFDPQYLVDSIHRHVTYFCIRKDHRIVALAAAEIDTVNQAAEMTDFATLSEYRRQGMAGCLLNAMDADMRQQGMQTAFSIARSLSAGMNITFAKNGYRYGGTLGNNTHIAGRIESMNIWYKHL